MPIALLDFKPHLAVTEEKPMRTVWSRIEDDAQYGSTPDLPKLRYAGPQHVFLWDHTKEATFWDRCDDIDYPNDIRCELYEGYTQNNLLPFRNICNFQGTYKTYLPLAPTWPSQMRAVDVGAFTSVTPKPLAGKIVSCSLRAIRFFDNYYCNGLVFDRVKMPIRHSMNSTVSSAWVYVNKLSSVFKYDPHEQKYKSSFDIDPVPLPCEAIGDVQCFKYSSTIMYQTERELAV